MGRSNGYRPKVAVRKEVLEWRAKLAECRDDQWVRAGCIMDNITCLLGHSYGPMNGKIQPRACKFCKYYGHTRQWCKKRIVAEKAREERELNAMLEEDRRLFARVRESAATTVEPYDPTNTGQARTFDKLGIPYTIDPDCGPIVGVFGEPHHGEWTFDESGQLRYQARGPRGERPTRDKGDLPTRAVRATPAAAAAAARGFAA